MRYEFCGPDSCLAHRQVSYTQRGISSCDLALVSFTHLFPTIQLCAHFSAASLSSQPSHLSEAFLKRGEISLANSPMPSGMDLITAFESHVAHLTSLSFVQRLDHRHLISRPFTRSLDQPSNHRSFNQPSNHRSFDRPSNHRSFDQPSNHHIHECGTLKSASPAQSFQEEVASSHSGMSAGSLILRRDPLACAPESTALSCTASTRTPTVCRALACFADPHGASCRAWRRSRSWWLS